MRQSIVRATGAALALTALALAALEGCALASPDSDAETVGQAEDLITSGHVASQGDLLATVALVRPGATLPHCTGALVAPSVVVTAAHCVDAWDQRPGLVAIGGALDVAAATGVERRNVVRVIVHSQFPGAPSKDPTSLGARNDVAVLGLDAPLGVVAPMPLLPSDIANAALAPGQTLVISGYGSIDSDDRDSGILRVGEVVVERRSEHEILAGGGAHADTCYRDSGGPAYAEIDGRFFLAGTTSRARADATQPCGEGTIFEATPAYASFIESAEHRVLSPRDEHDAGCSFAAAAPQDRDARLDLAALILSGAALRRRSRLSKQTREENHHA